MDATVTAARVPPLVSRGVLPRSKIDFQTEAGAGQLAVIIRKAWADVGHDVEAWVTKLRENPRGEPVFVVNTNLVNGLPPGLVRRRQFNSVI
jgi:hypothetical protein